MTSRIRNCNATEQGKSAPATDNQASDVPAPDETRDYLEGWLLMMAVLALNFANGVAFADSLALGAVLPAVAKNFSGDEIIEFAPTVQLIGATVGQCVLGYLSDVWSRRNMLLFALVLYTLAVLICGLSFYASVSAAGLFTAMRAFAGVSNGSVSNLVNISQQDILPERRRLLYQGVQGVSVALGSMAGIMLGATFAGSGRWENFYYIQTGLCACAALAIYCFVPAQHTMSNHKSCRQVFKTFDFIGIITGSVAVVCGLPLLCQHKTFPNSTVIILASLTSVFSAAFIVSGFRNLPGVRLIIPFHLFKNRTIAAIYCQNVLFGATYYTFIYFTPMTLQAVREIPLKEASAMLLPYFATHGASSTVSALIVRWLKDHKYRSYSYMFFFAFTIWTLAMALLAWDSTEQRGYAIVAFGILVGLGTGPSFQNSVMAISAQVKKDDKAVSIGTRNLLRYFGGAIGTALSTTIIQNVLVKELPKQLEDRAHSTIFDLDSSGVSPAEKRMIQDAYAVAIRWMYITGAITISVCLILNFAVRDEPMKKIQDLEKVDVASSRSSTLTITGSELGDKTSPASIGVSTPTRVGSESGSSKGSGASSGATTPGRNDGTSLPSMPSTTSLPARVQQALQKLEQKRNREH